MSRRLRPLVGALTTLLVRPSVWAGTFAITAIGRISEEVARNDLPDGERDEDGFSHFDDCDDTEPLIYPGASHVFDTELGQKKLRHSPDCPVKSARASMPIATVKLNINA